MATEPISTQDASSLTWEQQLKEEELKIKKEENEHKKEDLRLRREEVRISRWIGIIPIIVALISGGVAAYGYFNQRKQSLEIEKLRSESSLILGAVQAAGGDEEKTKRNVLFFLETQFIEDENGTIENAVKSGRVPLASANNFSQQSSSVYRLNMTCQGIPETRIYEDSITGFLVSGSDNLKGLVTSMVFINRRTQMDAFSGTTSLLNLQIAGVDLEKDLAILSSTSPLPRNEGLPLADQQTINNLKVGDPVNVINYTYDIESPIFQQTFIQTREGDFVFLSLPAGTGAGPMGAPVLSSDGKVIGVITQIGIGDLFKVSLLMNLNLQPPSDIADKIEQRYKR